MPVLSLKVSVLLLQWASSGAYWVWLRMCRPSTLCEIIMEVENHPFGSQEQVFQGAMSCMIVSGSGTIAIQLHVRSLHLQVGPNSVLVPSSTARSP